MNKTNTMNFIKSINKIIKENDKNSTFDEIFSEYEDIEIAIDVFINALEREAYEDDFYKYILNRVNMYMNNKNIDL